MLFAGMATCYTTEHYSLDTNQSRYVTAAGSPVPQLHVCFLLRETSLAGCYCSAPQGQAPARAHGTHCSWGVSQQHDLAD